MTRKQGKSVIQKVAYGMSAIVVLSMILSLLGPILSHPPTPPTPTWPPTWTPGATVTPFATATFAPSPTPSPAPAVAAPMPKPLDIEPGRPWSFAVAGDSRRNTGVYQQILDKIVQDHNAFLIHAGDLVDYGSKRNFEAFQKLMADFPLRFYPVPGNHDLDAEQTLGNYLAFSGAPAAHYSFDVDTVHFTLANSASGHLSQDELAWIDQDLAATDRPLRVVVMHYPPFDPDESGHILYSNRDEFMALMEKYQVDYVFTSHIHAYSRQERNGTVYIITGGAGAPLYQDKHPDSFYHYIKVTVDQGEIKSEVVALD